MRKSGRRPAVKRWKLACEMLRRAASGHIEVTQFSKLAAASRIAEAVISGCPEAPSSPLQGSGVSVPEGAACGCPVAFSFAFERVKRFSKKPSGLLVGDCARASPQKKSA